METKKINNCKALIKYSNWLLLNRGEIRPEVGDRIKYLCDNYTFTNEEIKFIHNDYLYIGDYKNESPVLYDDCYVEIDYNPNEAIEFTKWVNSNYIQSQNGNYSFCAFNGKDYFTTKELYNQFKLENNGK